MSIKKSAVKKSAVKTKKAPPKKAEPDIQVLTASTTKSVSGSSTLKYQIGIDAKSDIHIRVISSSGSGYVNPDWVPFNTILNILESRPAEAPFSSSLFKKALQGHSNNNVGFITAALIQEKILAPFGGQEKFKWKYTGNAKDFLAKAEDLKQKKPTK